MIKKDAFGKLFTTNQNNRIIDILDRLNFGTIFLIWMGILVVFGGIYYFGTTGGSYLYDSRMHEQLNFIDHIYFSFITATSTGFGDFLPVGFHRIIAIAEVVVGLILLAVVTSKLVSMKQEAILNEIYEISFDEKVNRLRSSLFVFRVDISKLVSKAEEGIITRREVSDVWANLSFLEGVIDDIINFFSMENSNTYTKNACVVHNKIIINSVNKSLEKLNEIFEVFREKGIEWERSITVHILEELLEKSQRFYTVVNLETPEKTAKEYKDLRKEYQDVKGDLSKILKDAKERLKAAPAP
ncbi:hypothetical protein JXB02_06580 [Candidatus Woesearchaeota archaeon]|nr:hypothetical protein [Candidatus Woesearchaeota archaeon]